jgi:hypothetical protein
MSTDTQQIVGEAERRLSVAADLQRAFAGRLVQQGMADEPADKLLERIRGSRFSGRAGGRASRPTRARHANSRKDSAAATDPRVVSNRIANWGGMYRVR